MRLRIILSTLVIILFIGWPLTAFLRSAPNQPIKQNLLDSEVSIEKYIQTMLYPNTPFKDFNSDAPWVHRGGLDEQIPIISFIKDAHLDSIGLDYVAFYRLNPEQLVAVYNPSGLVTIDSPFWYISLNNLTPNDLGLNYGDDLQIRINIRFRDQLIYHTYKYYLSIAIRGSLPQQDGWYRGDIHHHTFFTSDIFEYGGFPEFDVKAAKDIGMDWIAFTDHSYDVSASEWENLKTTAQENSTDDFIVLPGMEFSVDNNNSNDLVDDRVHLLGLGFDSWISGPDIVPGFDVFGSQPRVMTDILDDIETQGGVSYAAHPLSEITALSNWGFIKPWSSTNYTEAFDYESFVGMEIFNRRQTSFNNTGITTDNVNPFPWSLNSNWDTEWQDGITKFNQLVGDNLDRKIFFSGGADAHGDANFETSNNYGLVDVAANNNALGKVHTVAYLPNGLSQENLLYALKNGHSIVSDGPLVNMSVRRSGGCSSWTVGNIGDRINYSGSDKLLISGKSSDEFGGLETATVHIINSLGHSTENFSFSGNYDFQTLLLFSLNQTDTFAVWTEVETSLGYRSFSNPIWFNLPDSAFNYDIVDPYPVVNQNCY
ncbi:MAG: CehA/McbA family metallohydrolase [Candidatus Kerfeldbacteria bacterium]|jgi:hypothetical protein